jgi:hypothetical protein
MTTASDSDGSGEGKKGGPDFPPIELDRYDVRVSDQPVRPGRGDDDLIAFRVSIDATFMARDIDHALAVLAAHFADLAAYGLDARAICGPGSRLEIHPEEP